MGRGENIILINSMAIVREIVVPTIAAALSDRIRDAIFAPTESNRPNTVQSVALRRIQSPGPQMGPQLLEYPQVSVRKLLIQMLLLVLIDAGANCSQSRCPTRLSYAPTECGILAGSLPVATQCVGLLQDSPRN